MAQKRMRMEACLQLNQLITQALSKQTEVSHKNRDEILLEAKETLFDVLKDLSNQTNALLPFDLLVELSKIVAADESDLEEQLFRFHQLVSEAMKNRSSRETLILVNKELSQAMVDGSEEVIRQKFISVQHLLSKGLIGCSSSDEGLKAIYKMYEALSEAIAEKSEEKKLDLLGNSNLFLAEFMVANYPEKETKWLVELNHLAALALHNKIKNPVYFQKPIYLLAREMRKSPDEALLKDSLELIFTLSSMLMEEEEVTGPFYDQLITLKIQILKFIQAFLAAGSDTKKASKTATEEEEVDAIQTSALQADTDEIIKERDFYLVQTREMYEEQVELTREFTKNQEKVSQLVEELTKTQEKLSVYEEKEKEQTMAEKKNLLTERVEASEEGTKIAQGHEAEIAKVEQMKDEATKVGEAKSEAPAEEKGTGVVTVASANKQDVVGGEKVATMDSAGSGKKIDDEEATKIAQGFAAEIAKVEQMKDEATKVDVGEAKSEAPAEGKRTAVVTVASANKQNVVSEEKVAIMDPVGSGKKIDDEEGAKVAQGHEAEIAKVEQMKDEATKVGVGLAKSEGPAEKKRTAVVTAASANKQDVVGEEKVATMDLAGSGKKIEDEEGAQVAQGHEAEIAKIEQMKDEATKVDVGEVKSEAPAEEKRTAVVTVASANKQDVVGEEKVATKDPAGSGKKIDDEEATTSVKANADYLRMREDFMIKVYLPHINRKRRLKIDKKANLN